MKQFSSTPARRIIPAKPTEPLPPEVAEFSFLPKDCQPAKRGRPKGGKEQVTIRLDKDVLARFRATGDGWQGRINEILKEAKL